LVRRFCIKWLLAHNAQFLFHFNLLSKNAVYILRGKKRTFLIYKNYSLQIRRWQWKKLRIALSGHVDIKNKTFLNL
jgi:hypothetical protein